MTGAASQEETQSLGSFVLQIPPSIPQSSHKSNEDATVAVE